MNIYYLFFILITAIQLTYEQVAKECEIVSSFYGNDLYGFGSCTEFSRNTNIYDLGGNIVHI